MNNKQVWFNAKAALRQRGKSLHDQHLHSANDEDEETMSIEEMRTMLHETIKQEYARM